MVLPWVILGASAAMDIRRRVNGVDQVAENEKLQAAQDALGTELQMTKDNLEQGLKEREADKTTIAGLQTIYADLEVKLAEMTEQAELTRKENEDLKLSNAELEDRSSHLLEKFVRLEDASDALKKENQKLVEAMAEMSVDDRDAKVQGMLAELRQAIEATLQSFASGDMSPEDMQEKLSALGVDLGCSASGLDAIRQADDATAKAIEASVTKEFDSQMRLVTDSPDRLARLVAVSRQVHSIKGPPTPCTRSHSAFASLMKAADRVASSSGLLGYSAPSAPVPGTAGSSMQNVFAAATRRRAAPASLNSGSELTEPFADICGSENIPVPPPKAPKPIKHKENGTSAFGISFKGLSSKGKPAQDPFMRTIQLDAPGSTDLVPR